MTSHTSLTTVYEYHIKLGMKLQRMHRRLRKRNKKVMCLIKENERLREENRRLSAMKSLHDRHHHPRSVDNALPPNESRVNDYHQDASATDDELTVAAPTSVAVLLTPTSVPIGPDGTEMTIEDWRRSHGIGTKTLDLLRRFKQYIQPAKAYLIECKHILITNIDQHKYPSSLVIADISPVLYTLSIAAGAQRVALPEVIGTVKSSFKSDPVGDGMIIHAELTSQLVEKYNISAGTNATWSFLLPGVTNTEQLRSVMAFA